jgi:hypothetical protein
VILVDSVPGISFDSLPGAISNLPLLQLDLLMRRTSLSSNQLFEISYGIRREAFYSDYMISDKHIHLPSLTDLSVPFDRWQ